MISSICSIFFPFFPATLRCSCNRSEGLAPVSEGMRSRVPDPLAGFLGYQIAERFGEPKGKAQALYSMGRHVPAAVSTAKES